MNFKKILGSFLSAMTLFTTSPVSVMAYDIIDEASLNDYMTNTDLKDTGYIGNDITTTIEHEAKNAEIRFSASGNKTISGELLRFTNGSVTLSQGSNSSLTISNDIRLSNGVSLKNDFIGSYHLGRILGEGTIDFSSKAQVTASEIQASSLKLTGATLEMIPDASKSANGDITVKSGDGAIVLDGSFAGTTEIKNANKIQANSISTNAANIYAKNINTSSLSFVNGSKIYVVDLARGKNTGNITASNLIVNMNSNLYADTVVADTVQVINSSVLDLVGDETDSERGLSETGLLTVNGKLTINENSIVKANTIEAGDIDSLGKIIIGKDGAEAATISADSMSIKNGVYTNTILKGKTDDSSSITFASGGNVSFSGGLNQVQIKGGSKSTDATIAVEDDSTLNIISGSSGSSTNNVVFDNTKFVLGDNSVLNLNAQGNDIAFSNTKGDFRENIETSNTSEIYVKSDERYKVSLDNVNHGTDENKGTLTVSGNAQIVAGGQDTYNNWISGQVYVDKYTQTAGSTLTMESNSTLNANTIKINDASVTLKNIAEGKNRDKTPKDGIKAKQSFTATGSTFTINNGTSKIESDGSLEMNSSTIEIASGGVLGLSATNGVQLDKNTNITTDGELKIYGDGADNNIYGNIQYGVNKSGSLRKIGSSTLNLGNENDKSTVSLDKIIIGTEDGQKKDFVGGEVNINENVAVKNMEVVGDSTINLAEGVTLGIESDDDNFKSSSIRFETKILSKDPEIIKTETILNMLKDSTITAATIDLNVKEANLYGGTIGSANTSKIIFGNGSNINVYDEDVRIMANGLNSSDVFVTAGALINLTGKGSLYFDESPIVSSAHWTISDKSKQTFAADSVFKNILTDYKISEGGAINNLGGSVIIGDRTKFNSNHVGLKGGAAYNTGYFASNIIGGTSSNVSFENNTAIGVIDSTDREPGEVFGQGGAIYNDVSGMFTLGTYTTFRDNAAGQEGGAIYNEAINSQKGGISGVKDAISLGQGTWFDSNRANYRGGAIFATNPTTDSDSSISIGKKSSFDNNYVGFDVSEKAPNPTTPQAKYFYQAEGGAVYIEDGATLKLGEHSGFFTNFSTYSGSAISNNNGTVIFTDDGKINQEALQNGQVVSGSVKFADGGERNDVNGSNIFYTHQGGAIFNKGGKFFTNISDGTRKSGLYNASFVNNKALFGGAIYHYSLDTANKGESDLLSIENSTFSGNKAVKGIEIYKNPNDPESQDKWQSESSGGAIYNASSYDSYDVIYDSVRGYYPEKKTTYNAGSQIKITKSMFDNNAAVNNGGAIYNDTKSKADLTDVTFNDNMATKGAAIYNAAGATIVTNKDDAHIGEDGNKTLMFDNNDATRQMSGSDQSSPEDIYLGGALYNAGTIKQNVSTSSYDNELIDFEFVNNVAGAGVGNDAQKDTIGRGGAFYNASSGTTYIGNTKFDTNSTYAYTKSGNNSDSYKAEGGAVYNEQGKLIIGDGTVFVNNGRDQNDYENITTGRGGAIYNNANAVTEIGSNATFVGNAALNEGGAIYNAKDGTLIIKNGASIGTKDDNANHSDNYGGGVFNAGIMELEDGVSFVNNTAKKGGGLYLREGSTVNVDSTGLNHLSNVTFDGNYADYGAGLYVDKNVDIYLDNVTFKGNSSGLTGSAFYNAGNMTLGENNSFESNEGSLIGNSGTLTFQEGFKLDGLKAGNQGNTSFITNEENGVVNITTVDGKSLVITGVGNGSADGAAIALKDNSSINTTDEDGTVNNNTLKNAEFTKNNGNKGGAIYKSSTNDLTIDNTIFGENLANYGGAIYNQKGTLTIGSDTVFSNNSANTDGGAIYNAADATIDFDANFQGFAKGDVYNYASGKGGAVANYGKMNIKYTTEDSNSIDFSYQGKDSSTGNGGALYLANTSLVTTNGINKTDSKGNVLSYIKNGLFTNNTAQNGGALYNESNIVIEDTNFSYNNSGFQGGAIYNKGTIVVENGVPTVKYGNMDLILSENKTLTNNMSQSSGGALFNDNGVVSIKAKDGHNAIISDNSSKDFGGAISSTGENSIINVNGNVIFKDNGIVNGLGKGGAIYVSAGTLNLDTTDGDIIFEGNNASVGNAIYVENGATINFKGTDNEITFDGDQTIASDNSLNKLNVAGGNVNFESDMSDFNGQYTQTSGTVTVANNFMNTQGTDNRITGGTFILTEGAKLAPTNDSENSIHVNGNGSSGKPTIRFEKNSQSRLTDLSALYTSNNISNAGSSLTYTSDDLGDAKMTFTNAKLDLAFKQDFVDAVDSETGGIYRKNSGIYDLVLDGGADKKTLDIASDGKRAVSNLTVGDAVQIDTNIKVGKGGELSLEGAGLSENVKTIYVADNGKLNIFNDTYETIGADGIKTKYNTDLIFTGELKGDINSSVYKGYKPSATEDGLLGRAKLTFAAGSSAGAFKGSYTQTSGILEFIAGSTYFNHAATNVIYKGDSTLILNDGVYYEGNTDINFGEDAGGRFVLGTATDINMTNPNEEIKFKASTKDGDEVTNTVRLGKDTTIQFTHGKSDIDASDDTINIGKDNAFSGVIIGGDEDNGSGPITIKVNTVAHDGKDTTFNVEENGKLGFGDVKFVDTAGNVVTETYSPTVILDKNSEFYLVSGKDNDFNNLNLSTKANDWSQTSGSLIKENASKTTLKGDKTDLSGFHGTIVVKNGEIALGDDITESQKFADNTHFDVSQIQSSASVTVSNITQGDDMTFVNGIGNEIIGEPTGNENFKLTITNDKGGIKFVKEDGSAYDPDIDVKNGSHLNMEAKGDISVNDINVESKFGQSGGSQVPQYSIAKIISDEGNISTGAINVIGVTDGLTNVEADLGIKAKGDITTNDNNVNVKYGDLRIISQDGSITLGDSTDTTNPALKVENGSASVTAGGALTINGDVDMKGLTAEENHLIGSSVTMGNLTIADSADKKTYIQASGGNATINGDVTVSDVDTVQISASNGVNIVATTTNKGNVTVDNSKFDLISKTGDITVAGNVSATNNSEVSIGISDTGVGGIQIGNNEGSAISVVDSKLIISSKGLTKITGNVDFDNITESSGIYGNSVDVAGNIKVANSGYETDFIASDGSIKFGSLKLDNNKDATTGSNLTTKVDATNGNVEASSTISVINSDIVMGTQQTGDIKLNTSGAITDTAFDLDGGKATIVAADNLDINGNVAITNITGKTLLQGKTISAGDLLMHDNQEKINFVSTDGDISTNIISLRNNKTPSGNTTITIDSAGSITTNGNIVEAINSDLGMNARNGSIDMGALTIDNSKSQIVSINGGITTGNVTLQDTLGGNLPTSLVMSATDGNITSGDIDLSSNVELAQKTVNSGNITNGKITVKDNSKYTAVSAGNYSADDIIATVGESSESKVLISADGNINVKDITATNLQDLYLYSENGDITANDVTLNNVSSHDTTIGTVNDFDTGEEVDVELTNVIYAKNGKVTLGDLSLTNMHPDRTHIQAKNDVAIDSMTLANNKKTSSTGTVENKWTHIVSEDGNVNVSKDINVSSSNMVISAENGGISANDLIVKDSKTAPKIEDDPYGYGTIISAGTGDVKLGSVSVDDAVVGIGSTSGNIDISKTLTVTDSTATASEPIGYLRTIIKSDDGNVSIGKGVTATGVNPVNVVSANTNTYVEIGGNDVTIGNSSTATEIKANEALLGIKAGNDLNAEKTSVVANDSNVLLEAENALKIGSISATTTDTGLENGNVTILMVYSENGNIEVNGNISASTSVVSVDSETGTKIKGNVDIKNSEAAFVSPGDITVDGKVSFDNAATLTTTTTGIKRYLNDVQRTSENADTPDEDINDYIAQIKDAVSSLDPSYIIDGKNVKLKNGFNVDSSVVYVGGNGTLSKLEVNGATNIDDSVVMINSSGDVVTNGFTAKDSIIYVNSANLRASSMNVSSSAETLPAYFEMTKGNIDVTSNLSMKNTILNAKNTNNIAVGGAGTFNNAFLNIPNANAQFGSLKTTNTVVNLQNNNAHNTINVTGNYDVSGDNLYYVDFDPTTGSYDRIHAGGAMTGSEDAYVMVNSNLVNKGDVAKGYQVYDVFSANGGISRVKFGLEGDTAYSTALANYQMQNLGNGKYAFKRTGYTPAALVNPVAVQIGGFLTQVQTYDTAFDNLDMVMMLPMTAYGPNRYAVSEAEDAMVYSPLFIPELEKGVWFRPFANFESVDMHQVNGRISSQTYGALVGGDTALKDLGNGYQGMMSAYVGYTGSHQDLKGVSNYQNGGVVGVTGAIYKNGFFSGLTVSANASGNSASTPYGSNDFFMLTAGAASKTGYNWELANGRFIIQPSWLMSYTFADVFSPNDFAGMKVDANALHGVQLAPGLKFIGNFQNGWQPYLTVDYRFNLCDKADYKVGVVDLPDAQVKSYIEYGLGMQKRWGDRFTGYGQFLGRGIGRNGVGLNLGMRWMVGAGRNPR